MGLRVVIIEDEPAISRHLKVLLQRIEDTCEILTILDSVKSGSQWLLDHENEYDLIFSDIQLLDGTSFEIFQKIEIKKPIIFITAYDEYTLKAFQTNGIYYIIKPFDEEDLIKALKKYRTISPKNAGIDEIDFKKLLPIIENLEKSNTNYKKAYLVHYQNKLLPIKTDDIAWFFTENEVVYAHTFQGKRYTLDSTLERVALELSPSDFIRVNRKFILRRESIKDIDFYFHGRLIVNVIPAPEQQIIISKAKVPVFKKWMNQDCVY